MTVAPRPRMANQSDYALPNTVYTNIPHQNYHGAPGLWAYARGVLIETCYALPWIPLSLFVRVNADDSTDDTTAIVLTMIARDEHNKVVTVVWRQDHGTDRPGSHQPNTDRTGTSWQLTIDGAIAHQGTGGVRPSPPLLADIIRHATTT